MRELDDILEVDLSVEEKQQERATWDVVDDMMAGDNDSSDEDSATYYLWKTNLSLPEDDEAAINRITRMYSRRWRIESGYRALKKFLTPTTSPSHELRFWYFSFASLLYSVWRLVDVILREQEGVEANGPVVPAATVISFLRRSTGVG